MYRITYKYQQLRFGITIDLLLFAEYLVVNIETLLLEKLFTLG